MATYSRLLLSGTPGNGRVIPVAAVATPGTLVHAAIAGDGGFDELYVWASNVTNAAALLTIEWGGVTDPGDHLIKEFAIPANSAAIPVAVGQVINGGLEARAFSDTIDAINLSGFVNRIAT